MKKKNLKPVSGFFDMRDEFLQPFDQVFDQMLSNQFPTFYEQSGIDFLKGAYPKCNIIDTVEDVQVIAEIPGLTKEDVNIKVEEGVMTISGKHSTVLKGHKTEIKYIRRELKHSSFKRSFELSDKLDSSKISAKFENGILNIVIPKKEEALPKTIDITID